MPAGAFKEPRWSPPVGAGTCRVPGRGRVLVARPSLSPLLLPGLVPGSPSHQLLP